MAAEIRIERLAAGRAAPYDFAGDVFDHDVTPQGLQAYLSDPRHILIVARDGARIIGQARGIIHLHPDTGSELYVDNLGVAADRQRRGIATKLMRELLRIGKQAGCRHFWLATEPDNDAAAAFYRAFGLTGSDVKYFGGEI